MVFKNQERLTVILSCILLLSARVAAPAVQAQESSDADSLVRLVKGASVQLIEKEGKAYRKAVDATFLHNGTYLICDTALWNVDTKIIEAQGNVRIIQEETVLTSDRLDYYIDESVARFRGSLVQLRDKDSNTLRTKNLDYNTKDSTAVFYRGGSMRSHDGQVIESQRGTYDSKSKFFTFLEDVNMFTDSVFIKTEHLDYDTQKEFAHFRSDIDFWKDGNMLSSGFGWYDHRDEIFFFRQDVHGTTESQESWSDSLYFYRKINDVSLLGNAQVQDTAKNVFALADSIYYCDSLSLVILRRNAAVAVRTGDSLAVYDTLYFGADALEYRTLPRCAVDSILLAEAASRRNDILSDPVEEYRRKAAEEAARKAEEARKEAEESGTVQSLAAASGKKKKGGDAGSGDVLPSEPAALSDVPDGAPADSLGTAPADSLSLPVQTPDSTKTGFLTALKNVRFFRKDVQIKADSLLYSDLDSVARFYVEPVIWNEGNRQYMADSIFCLVSGGRLNRASLMSSAFIITEETGTQYYDQIKSTEVLAHFDSTSSLSRFDALGGVNALFYIKEKEKIGTVNKVDSKMLSARFKNGEMDRAYYFDAPKNDAYPVVQLPEEDHRMRGFQWLDELRPKNRLDITPLQIRPSQRQEFASREKGDFHETEEYFPGYMHSVYSAIAVRDSVRAAREAERERMDSLSRLNPVPFAPADSLDSGRDTTAAGGNTPPAEAAAKDSSAVKDSTAVAAADTLGKATLSAKELRKAKREERRRLREAKREERWKAKDERDRARAAARKKKALERKAARERLILERQRAQDARDDARREKFRLYYEKQKARKDSESPSKPSPSTPQESIQTSREN